MRCIPSASFELRGQLLDRLRVERGLLAAERAERFELGLVRQVRDHRLVGLQSPQNVWPHQFAQRAVGIVRPLRQALGELRELIGRTQQARIDEIEDRPQIAQPVLDRRAGEGEARAGLAAA